MYYREGNTIHSTGTSPYITNLDDLPIPAWHLYNIKDYFRMSRLLAKKLPVTMAEFSRGCVFKCDFCASKITMSLGYRKKSPKRCVEEVKHLYDLGYREFALADDIFTSDQKWATSVCDAIYRTNVDIAWTCTNGIRVESADDNLFKSMKRAGCYRVAFGFESGSDQVLKDFGKGGKASVKQARTAVKKARSAGIDTTGFFLLGLSPDNESTMNETIEFAKSIPLDMMKFGIAIAFPGTIMFDNYVQKGLVKSFDWDDYFIYTSKHLFVHENLSYDTIHDFMNKAYRQCILFNFSFIFRRILRGLKTGEFFWDLYYGIKFFLMPTIGEEVVSKYYNKKKWPKWDYSSYPPKPSKYQIVGKKQAA